MADDVELPSAAGRIIDRFGGIRPMAAKLDTPVTTVQGWKKRGIIPQARHADILAVAAREGLVLDAAEVAATDPTAIGRPEARPAESVPPVQPSPVAPIPSHERHLPPAPKPVIVRRGGGAAYGALFLSVAVLAGVVAGGAAGWRFYLEPLRDRVAALEARKVEGVGGDLTARVVKLETQMAGPAAPVAAGAQPTSPSPDGDRLAALEKDLADLKSGVAQSAQFAKGLSDLQIAAGGRELLAQSIRDIQSSTAATQGEVERLATQLAADKTRLDRVEANQADKRQQALRAEAVVLGVGQLRAALKTSKPYISELTAIRGLAGSDPEIVAALDQLQPTAEGGVPTIDELSKEFGRIAPEIVRSAVVGDGQSWWRQALYHLESVISVRRVGDAVPGNETDAIVARAEGKLDEDDLQGAIAALQSLTGLSGEVSSPWIRDAHQRLAVDQAEVGLSRLVIGRLSAGNPPVQAPAVAPAAPATQ